MPKVKGKPQYADMLYVNPFANSQLMESFSGSVFGGALLRKTRSSQPAVSRKKAAKRA